MILFRIYNLNYINAKVDHRVVCRKSYESQSLRSYQHLEVLSVSFSESKILPQLKKVQDKKIDSLIVIINSYGGSLRVAKNIAFSL